MNESQKSLLRSAVRDLTLETIPAFAAAVAYAYYRHKKSNLLRRAALKDVIPTGTKQPATKRQLLSLTERIPQPSGKFKRVLSKLDKGFKWITVASVSIDVADFLADAISIAYPQLPDGDWFRLNNPTDRGELTAVVSVEAFGYLCAALPPSVELSKTSIRQYVDALSSDGAQTTVTLRVPSSPGFSTNELASLVASLEAKLGDYKDSDVGHDIFALTSKRVLTALAGKNVLTKYIPRLIVLALGE